MALNLTKGDKLNLTKENGQKLTNFCIGLNWGGIQKKRIFGGTSVEGVDLDASCVIFDENKEVLNIVSFRNLTAPGIKHSGDDRSGDSDGDDGLDNEIIKVDLTSVSPKAENIVFFLNSFKNQDFATIPYAKIRIYEGTPTQVKEIFANYNIVQLPEYSGKVTMIMGKLYKRNNEWKFETIGIPINEVGIDKTVVYIKTNCI